jgi:hypothetical protein
MQNGLSQMPSHTFSSQCMTLPCCAPVAWASSCWEMKLEFCLMIWKKHFGFVYGSASQDNVSLQSYNTGRWCHNIGLASWFHVSVSELEISRHTKLPRPYFCKIKYILANLFIGRTKNTQIKLFMNDTELKFVSSLRLNSNIRCSKCVTKQRNTLGE